MSNYFFKDLMTLLAVCVGLLAVMVVSVQYTKWQQRQHTSTAEVQAQAEALIAERDAMRAGLVELAGAASHYDKMGRNWREFVAEGIMEGRSE